MAWSKVDLLKARPNDVCHSKEDYANTTYGDDYRKWYRIAGDSETLETQLLNQSSEFPKGIVWENSA